MRILHFCGLSAVGKKSLIRKILNPEANHIRSRFGFDHLHVRAYGPNFEYSCFQEFEEPYTEHLYGGLLAANSEIVLHQWQWMNNELVTRLAKDLPKARHEAYLLWLPWEDHRLEIILHRPPWKPSVKDLKLQWANLVSHSIAWASLGVSITMLDARTMERVNPS